MNLALRFLSLLVCTMLSSEPSYADPLPRRAALGVQLETSDNGVRIQSVLPGGTAEALGLAPGDVLKRIDNRTIRSLDDVFAWVGGSASEMPVTVSIQRDESVTNRIGKTRPRPVEARGSGYRVEYGSVRGAHEARLRTMVSIPDRDGPHPALMLIQGVTLSSVDTPLTDANPYARLLGPFARAGYVTMRVDKPGVGDSEGGPGSALDFNTELAGYRAALDALRTRPDVDSSRVFIVGHSMGGIWAPLLAKESKVAGIAVFGSVFRTWNEYDLENARRQFRLGSASAREIHDALMARAMLNSALLLEGIDPNQAAKRHPLLASAIREDIVGDQWNGRTVRFWQQLASINIAQTWLDANSPVLAMHGGADFVSARNDHELLAEAVRASGVEGEFASVPGADHGFGAAQDERSAFAAIGTPSTYHSGAGRLIDRWLHARTGLRAFSPSDLTLEWLPSGTGAGRTMDASLGDLDGDGDEDLVLAKEFAPNVLLMRNGNRFETAPGAFPASAEDSEDAVLGDFDGDGDLDVVFPSEDTGVNEYFLNDGKGRFTLAPNALPSKTTSNAGVAGDIDSDGDLDLILSRNTAAELVLLNDGRGRFSDATSTWMPSNIDVTQDLKLADLDGDSDLDLVVGNEPTGGGRNRIYRNNGKRFLDISVYALPAPSSPEQTRKITIGDIDRDGDLDMYIANVDFAKPERATPRLLLNDGRGKFVDGSTRLPDAHRGSVLDAQFVDLNQDGDTDLLLGTLGHGTRLLVSSNGRLTDRTPENFASGEPNPLGIVALSLPGVGLFESAFDRGDRVLSIAQRK